MKGEADLVLSGAWAGSHKGIRAQVTLDVGGDDFSGDAITLNEPLVCPRHGESRGVKRTEEEEKKAVELKADVAITYFDIKTPVAVNQSTTSDFEVTNKGNGKAEGCQLIWNVPGLNGAITSEKFDLEPGEKKTFTLTSNVFTSEGSFTTKAYLSCGNTDATEKDGLVVVHKISNAPRFPQ